MRGGRLLQLCSSAVVLVASTWAQNVNPATARDGVYEVAISQLKRLDSSPKIELPRELSTYELVDDVAVALTITAEGRVKQAKAISGRSDALKELAANMAKRWAFQPYLVNGVPVPVRTQIILKFNNTLDHYRDPSGDIPVQVEERVSQTLVTKRVQVEYPPEARMARIQGKVELRAIVGVDGRVHALHIVVGHPLLTAASYNAVRLWEFKPYVLDGKTLPIDTRLTVNFTLTSR